MPWAQREAACCALKGLTRSGIAVSTCRKAGILQEEIAQCTRRGIHRRLHGALRAYPKRR
jgi:hypothetical protein